MINAIEMCAGAGGQALGLHLAGIKHELLIEIDEHAAATLNFNNQQLQLGWKKIVTGDLKDFAEKDATSYRGKIDLVAGGVPCPPFSKAGKQLGSDDERDLFPTAIDIVRKVDPMMVMLENVPGLAEAKFTSYRNHISNELSSLGYDSEWKLLQASDYGVPQLRPRVIMVAIKRPHFQHFSWPTPHEKPTPTVGEALYHLMSENGWDGVDEWKSKANKIAPTVVGGSKKHGGPDLGPTRAKRQWSELGVNAHRLANDNEVPTKGFIGAIGRNGKVKEGTEYMPQLTVKMASVIQGFPEYWTFTGTKTHAYRQVGNAFPPPVAQAVGKQLMLAYQKIKESD
ncbi:DNA cytosine methyltransferase [Shewanella algae]|uniref:Cytosine-specific methyltransferase n=1 Tax=Shewanella algae TaxID=38313 RepID=A0AAD1KBP7_9GAMM|nr:MULTISPECIES: DNA cytosine methyltransferase [Shewanella]MBO2595768.1 DNA cytosine methyltransferase [Shewanella algae]MBO2667124.1 DNA cytosine methyltransferase [Shewanella algae]NDO75992.1 DNA cytosine methyltransferase [Shewanella sp. SE1]BCV45596.1 cytosine-specific methyltransferase [Shewanella algae]BCV67129.1 cytosine-specific methyltransferase [Shewanella carassii]